MLDVLAHGAKSSADRDLLKPLPFSRAGATFHEAPWMSIATLDTNARLFALRYFDDCLKLFTTEEKRQLQEELKRGKRNSEHEPLYTKYFHISTTPGRGSKVVANQEAIDEAKKNYGYFALISNEVKDPIEALELYRNKDLIEKAFGNLKERLNFRRTRVSSESSLDGKLFVTFVALIYLSYVKKKMQENNLFSKYTLQSLLDELDVIECFEQPEHKRLWGEITKKQMDIYTAMGVAPPSLQ